MCRLNSSHRALITLLSFVSVEIPQHMARLWTLLLAPRAHAQSMEQGHPTLPVLHEDLQLWIPALTEDKKIKPPTALRACWENSPPASTGCLKVKQTRPNAFLGNHLARQVKGLGSCMGFGKRSPCLFLPSAYLQPQHPEPSLPSVYIWHRAKSRGLAGLPSWAGKPSHCHL